MTENEARALLLTAGYTNTDRWIAEQPWKVMPGGWWVMAALESWRFMVQAASARRVRVTAFPLDAAPTVWLVPHKRQRHFSDPTGLS